MDRAVIYIVSDVRSGSTLLENVLSSAKSSVSVGELSLLSSFLHRGEVGRHVDWKCTCGEQIERCGFWGRIISRLGSRGVVIRETSMPPATAIDKSQSKEEITDGNDEIYNEVFDETGATLIIDSSKKVDQGICLYKHSIHKIKIVYIKRDIRAVTASKHKWSLKFYKKKISPIRMLIRSIRVRIRINKALAEINPADLVCVRYEDLSRNPQATIDRITQKLELNPFQVPAYMDLRRGHSIGGTPNRYEKTPIKHDDKWKTFVEKRPFFNLLGKVLEALT